MFEFFKNVTLLLICSVLFGCSTFQGGMPNLPFNVEEELGIVKSELKNSASVKTYYESPSSDTRNKFIASRLVITNIEYLNFIKNLSAEESQIHSATDILVLSLNVLSASFTPVNTKTSLSALSSMIGGGRLSIDKNAYHEKTMSALISAMNAQRKDVLKRLLKGAQVDLNVYSFEQALSDINDYYLAGTFNGALASIQHDAAIKEDKADGDIKTFMMSRESKFVDATTQARVASILANVDKLSEVAVFNLVNAPPVTDQFTDNVVTARDPQGLRSKDKNVAQSILKMRVVLSKRDESNLSAWEASVSSLLK